MHSSTHSSYLFIEKHHSVSNSVTVYDPHQGIQIPQISSLVFYKVNTLIFKRSSYRSLVCPNLLQRFALVSPTSPPSSTYSPYCIISLFDGSGSFSDVIANAVGTWAHAILAAEMDAGPRSVVSKVKGWSVEGSIWTRDRNNAHTFYNENVWSLIEQNCLLLRQFISLLPENCVIFLGAGSPCPDLTVIGRGNGVLGLTGDRSVHIHCVWAVLFFLSHTPFWKRVVILVENAGSMQPHMKKYILQLLGIQEACAHTSTALNGVLSPPLLLFFVNRRCSPSPFSISLRWRLDYPWLCHPIPPLSYHPKNLLYDISYFGSKLDLEKASLENFPLTYPAVPFKEFLQEFLWKDWDAFIEWKADFDSTLTSAITETVGRLQDFYDNPNIYLPFRLPSLDEKAKDSELSELIQTTIQEANPPLRTLHNIIGNFFKPSAVLAALGGPDSIKNYVCGGLAPSEWAPVGPSAVDLQFDELKTKVHADTISNPDLRTHIAERWFPQKLPPPDKGFLAYERTHYLSSSPYSSDASPAPR